MSFDSFSPEVIMLIFSNLLDVRTKIRLQRVSTKFRDCIRNGNSWKHNTELEISDTTLVEEVRSILRHTQVITMLSLLDCSDTDILGCLFACSDKLKVTHFTHNPVEDGDACPKNKQVVACCLGKFTQSLTTANVSCCVTNGCETLKVFASLLPLCKNLQHLTLSDVCDVKQGEEEPFHILNSLQNMSLKSIKLSDFEASEVSAARLAAVCNTSKGHSLSSLTIEDGEYYDERVVFRLDRFCEFLEPAGTQAVKTLSLKGLDCGWVSVLPTLPVLLPNLSHVSIVESIRGVVDNADVAMKKAGALGSLMYACLPRENIIQLDLQIQCSKRFSNRLWSAIDLTEVAHRGTKHREDTRQWKRTITNGIATIKIESLALS